MNWQHLQAFLWLRGRLLANLIRRGGTVNAVVLVILAVAGVLVSAGLCVTAFLLGLLLLPWLPPVAILFAWDVLVLLFLFSWSIGLLTELQRSEPLSLDKFLHLPVSLSAAFLINYVSSLLSVSLGVFFPAMVGLSLALVFARGPLLLLHVPLLAAFILMVTALTYQFQGWLAAMMANPRRRRAVVVFVTMGFVLICQLPQLINVVTPYVARQEQQLQTEQNLQENLLLQERAAGKINDAEYVRRHGEIQKQFKERRQEMLSQVWERVTRTAAIANAVLPPGWLPLGAMKAAEGEVLPPLLCTLGMGLIGAASLWRAYGTTRRLYTGQFNAGSARAAAPEPVAPGKLPANLLDRDLPWLSDDVAAVTLATFRSVTRAPEAKMALLAPIILVVVFGMLFVVHRPDLPEPVRPLLAFGATWLVLLTMVGLLGNQFGFDRDGFRVFVLCPARRRDVLLGKNLACAPLVLVLCLFLVTVVQVLQPMRVDHFLAALLQMGTMYLLFCLVANLLSILGPMRMNAGTMKPSNPKVLPVLLQLLFLFLFPMVVAPTLLPLGLEFLLGQLGWGGFVPLYLASSLLFCVGAVFLYRLVLPWEGKLLQAREQHILAVITAKT